MAIFFLRCLTFNKSTLNAYDFPTERIYFLVFSTHTMFLRNMRIESQSKPWETRPQSGRTVLTISTTEIHDTQKLLLNHTW